MTTTTQLTVAGLFFALAIHWANLRPWLKSSSRDPKDLAPFAHGWALGALSTLCVGGLFGAAAAQLSGANNSVAGRVVPGATGSSGATIAHGTAGQLTAGGGGVVFLLAVGLVIAWRSVPKGDEGKKLRRRMFGGAWCGASLAYSAGVSGVVAVTLVPVANAIGDKCVALANGAGLL